MAFIYVFEQIYYVQNLIMFFPNIILEHARAKWITFLLDVEDGFISSVLIWFGL